MQQQVKKHCKWQGRYACKCKAEGPVHSREVSHANARHDEMKTMKINDDMMIDRSKGEMLK